MEKLDSDSARLIEELNLVIQTDKEAVEMVQNAYKTKQSIEQKTAKERKEILQEAENLREVLEKRVAQEQAKELTLRQTQARETYLGAYQNLQKEMQNNKDGWVEEIYQSILHLPQE